MFQADAREDVKKIKAARIGGKKEAMEKDEGIFGELLGSNLPEEEKTIERLTAESSSLIGAGTETTK